jgi:hypothetical protein
MRLNPSNNFVAIVSAAILALILGFAYGATFSDGCSEAIPAGAVLGCAEFVLFRYQTLIGIAGALLAAWLTARPVWQQLLEMNRQGLQAEMTHLRARSIELSNEEILIYKITSSIVNTVSALADFARANVGGVMLPQAVEHVKEHEKIMNGMITAFSESIGPRWGDLTVQNARTACRENAQSFSVALARYTNDISARMPFHQAALDAACLPLVPLKNAVFEAAGIIFNANRDEQAKIGARITALERSLYAG